MKAKYLRVGELIERLKLYDPDLPVIVTREGKGHSFGINPEEITVIDSVYFPSWGDSTTFEKDTKFLNLANI